MAGGIDSWPAGRAAGEVAAMLPSTISVDLFGRRCTRQGGRLWRGGQYSAAVDDNEKIIFNCNNQLE